MHRKTIWFLWEIIWWNTPWTKSNMFTHFSCNRYRSPEAALRLGLTSPSRAHAPPAKEATSASKKNGRRLLWAWDRLLLPSIAQYCPVLPSIVKHCPGLPISSCIAPRPQTRAACGFPLWCRSGEAGQDFNSWLRCFCVFVYMSLRIQA